MLNWSRFKTLARISLAVVCAPLCLAGTCPSTVSQNGSCCVNGSCSVTTQANCTGTFTSGGTCSPNPCGAVTQTTLINGTFTSSTTTGVVISQSPCYTAPAPAHNFLQQTFNATAGKLVTLSVTGPTATSRPRILVTDLFNSVVANSGGSPTTQTTTTTFTPTGTQLFIMLMEDCAPSAAAANYTVLVTQAP